MKGLISTKSYWIKFGLIFGTCLVVAVIYFRPTLFDGNAKERNFLLMNVEESSQNIPEFRMDMLKSSNMSDMFAFALRKKYGPIDFQGVKSISTALTPEEEQTFRTCVDNGPKDRERNGSKFWGKNEHIRRSHHTYLKNENAVLMEVGGNKGNDASEFVRLYNPRYIILEPIEEYANILTDKFKDNSRVTVINLGLGEKNEIVMVKIEGNNACATSKFSGKGGETPLYIANATEFLLKIGLGLFDIDLLTMNCEGCEFETLETLLSTNLVEHVRNIQFATHSTISGLSDPIGRYCRTQQLLRRTHRPTYQYKFIWESWRRKDIS